MSYSANPSKSEFYPICLPLQVMEFYCESCETAMCLDCTEGEHREHVTVPLRDVVEQHKAVLKTQLDAIHSRWRQIWYSDKAFRILPSHQVFGSLSFLAQIWHLPSKITYVMLSSVCQIMLLNMPYFHGGIICFLLLYNWFFVLILILFRVVI